MSILNLYQWKDFHRAALWLSNGIHVVLSLILIWIGCDLLRPGSTFDGSSAWTVFREMCPEENVWGLAYLIGGLAGLAGFLVPSSALLLGALWVTSSAIAATAVGFLISSSLTTGSGTMGLVALVGYGLFILKCIDIRR